MVDKDNSKKAVKIIGTAVATGLLISKLTEAKKPEQGKLNINASLE